MSFLPSPQGNSAGALLDNHLSVQAAAEFSGYNVQYLRRLVRSGEVEGVKIGQMWLVDVASLEAYLKRVRNTDDRRYGPRVYQAYIDSQKG